MSGYEFLKLTKPQWKHLMRIQRRHGIPWHVYIKDLIKADMEGRLIAVKKKKSKEVAVADVKKLYEKMEEVLSRLSEKQIPVYLPQAPPPPPTFEGILRGEIVEENAFKPSKMKKVDPNRLSDGSSLGDIRTDFMTELRGALGLPPIEEERTKKKAAAIQLSSNVAVKDA